MMYDWRCLAVCILLFGVSAAAHAEMIKVRVSEDESVVSDVGNGLGDATTGYPTVNPHFTYSFDDSGDVTYNTSKKKGVLWTGVLQSGDEGDPRTRFYLKFVLPDIPAGYSIQSATLKGFYLEDPYDNVDLDQEIHYVANDNWSEKPVEYNASGQPMLDQSDPSKGITWNNQPLLDPTLATPLTTFNLAGEVPWDGTPATWQDAWVSWDITKAVLDEYGSEANPILSLMFKAADESFTAGNTSYEKFQEKDCSCCEGFVICLKIVPAPSVLVGLVSMGAMAGVLLSWRRRRAVAR